MSDVNKKSDESESEFHTESDANIDSYYTGYAILAMSCVICIFVLKNVKS